MPDVKHERNAGRARLARWRNRLANRFLLNATVVVLVVYVFGCVAASFASRLALASRRERSREILTSLSDAFERKHDEFLNIVFPLYDVRANYETLSMLLENSPESPDMVTAGFRQRAAEMMASLAARDNDIVAILLHGSTTGARYVYFPRIRMLDSAPAGFPYFAELQAKPSGRVTYGVRSWRVGQTEPLTRAFGIASTLATRALQWEAGSLLVAYNSAILHRVFQRFQGTASGRYLLVTDGGEAVFDSWGRYETQPVPFAGGIATAGASLRIDGVEYQVTRIPHESRRYSAIILESRAKIAAATARSWLVTLALASAFAFIAVFLYLRAGLLVSGRVRELEAAMQRVGAHDLAHRIPVTGRDDELSRVAASYNRMCDELQENITKLYVHELKEKTAELHALQAGINPHFLFNALQAVSAKAREAGDDEVAELLVLLSTLMRNIVRSQTFIPIRQELEFCRIYLELFALRYGERFRYEMDVDPEIADFGIPKNVLQPVLENYFVHGIREDREDNVVRVLGGRDGGGIAFRFEDNGKGMDPKRLAEMDRRLAEMDTQGDAYGLPNVHERLRLVYGDSCGLKLESLPGVWTRVTLRIRALSCEELERSISVAGA